MADEADESLRLLERQARRLETANSIIQTVHGELILENVVNGIVASFVEVGGFAGAEIVIDATIENLHMHHEAIAGERSDDPALACETSVFIRGMEIGKFATYYRCPDEVEEQSEMLEFLLPTLFMGIDHAVSFAEVNDYRATLERKVVERTSQLAEAHQQLSKTLDDLREVKASRDRFFANINHEIRTPLTLIQLAVEAIGRARSPEVTRLKLDEINAGSRRLLHLVNGLLLLAAGDEGKLRIRPGPLDVAACIQRLVRNWASAGERGQIAIVYDGPPSAPSSLDEAAIETIVGNFVSNAVKFTPPGGRVTVTLEVTDDTITARVRDTGPSIDPEFIPRLFGRFERSASAIETGVRGTGIGLSLAKELVDLQGGTVEVLRHDDPLGTSFSVTVPRHQAVAAVLGAGEKPDRALSELVPPSREAPAESPSGPIPTTDEPRGATATILVAEDDPAIARHVEEILSERYRVLLAPDGLAALEVAREHLPDMLVTDLEMPRMNGIELTREFLKLQGTALSPVLIVTAHADMGQRLRGFDAGAVDYVVKPFSADELLARIRSQLAMRTLALKLHQNEKLAAMGMLSAGLAHELRNPANAVVNIVDLLFRLLPENERQPESVGAQLYQVLKDSSTQIRELCRNILQFSRSGDVAKTPQDIRQLIRRSRSVVHTQLATVKVVEEIATDRPVECAGLLIQQILVNLLDNAVYAAGRGGSVTITAHHEGDLAVIEVGDSGPGVPANLRERIFEPFFTTKPIGEGTGLGLAVSRRIALDHGGDLRVVGRGAGTVFRLEIPSPSRA